MNTITFTATITVREDCEDLTDEQLLQFARYYLEANAVVEVIDIKQQATQ